MTTENNPQFPLQSERGRAIWQAVLDLKNQGQVISRQRLRELTGFKFVHVDDHVSRWVDNGLLIRVLDGVYELPAPVIEPRAMSVTDLHDGTIKIEAGDQQMRVCVSEARALARQLGGFANEVSQLQTQHHMGVLISEFTARNHGLHKQIRALERQVRAFRSGVAEPTADAEDGREENPPALDPETSVAHVQVGAQHAGT